MRPTHLLIAFAALALQGSCGTSTESGLLGYAEGEYVLVASPFAGNLQLLSVARGDAVEAGARLFAIEQDMEAAAHREAEQRLRAAQARLANLQAAQRPDQQDAVLAQRREAEAARRLSATQLDRDRALFEQGHIARSRLDEAEAALRRDEARVAEVEAQIRLARSSIGRNEELAVAGAEVEAAAAVLAQAAWRLAQKTLHAPEAGRVHDTFFVAGEWVPAGRPVVSLLPPANIKLRFYVPEPVLSQVQIGQTLTATCDGCPEPVPATVSYVSTEAEYTPPIIYSRESRAKLVFRAEARPSPEAAARLKPGQPVEILLTAR
ncbi:MAG: HlyD family efflux transporter periplasmic adaptor subunit [Pseudomonadales bacterium]